MAGHCESKLCYQPTCDPELEYLRLALLQKSMDLHDVISGTVVTSLFF
jgi:hypothetical protein